MPRGGSRRGAGRKPTLPIQKRFLVCARVRAEWEAMKYRRGMEKHKVALNYEDIECDRAALNELSLKERKQLSSDMQELIEWLSVELDGRRLVTAKSPQGEYRAMVQRITREESQRNHVTITPRMVKRWLIEYHAFLKV